MKKEMKKKHKRLLFWGFFWRYGVIILTLLLPLLLVLIFKDTECLNGYMDVLFMGTFSAGLCVMGIAYLVGVICEKPFILLCEQLALHSKMDPTCLSWEGFNKKEWIGVATIFLVLGLIGITYSVVQCVIRLKG